MSRYIVLLLLIAGCSKGGGDGQPVPVPDPVTPCQLSVEWTNPTEDVNGNLLGDTDLTAATVYFFRIPEAPRDADMIHAAEAYTLRFTFVGSPSNRDITYYIWLTVSNEYGESDASNQVTRECT